MRQVLVPEVERLRPAVHRNYIPGHKKGGSISSFTLTERAPVFRNLYRSAAFMEFLGRLVGARVMPCPGDGPHACALYFYSEPGDHIGFHYDTSYYKGARYTVLPGLIQQTETCRLVAHLYKDDPKRERMPSPTSGFRRSGADPDRADDKARGRAPPPPNLGSRPALCPFPHSLEIREPNQASSRGVNRRL